MKFIILANEIGNKNNYTLFRAKDICEGKVEDAVRISWDDDIDSFMAEVRLALTSEQSIQRCSCGNMMLADDPGYPIHCNACADAAPASGKQLWKSILKS
jgi:hypothetical protein